MKKLFLFSVAALAFAACSNDETVSESATANQPQEIAISPLTQNTTRAISNTNYGYINGTTFNTDWGMTVSAVDITNSREFFGATNFLYNYVNGSSGSSALWGAETNARYWPLSPAQINFLAIAHGNSDNATTNGSTSAATWSNTTSNHKVEFVMANNYAYNTAQRDFIYAIGNGQVTQIGNNLSFPTKVDMTFKHTQAYLVFKVQAADAASCGITITNIELKNVWTQGTATIARTNPGTYADDNTSLTWNRASGNTDAGNYRSVTESQAAISYDLTTTSTEKGHLLVVPNMTTANTAADNGTTMMKISYTLDGKAYTYEYEITNDTWDAGKKYIYDITFKLHEIFVSPSVTDWADGGTTVIYIPSVAFNESGANVSIGNTAGTYTFTISSVPTCGESSYSFVEADANSDNLDFIDGDITIVENTVTSSAAGNITLKFKSTGGDDGKKHLIKLKLGETEKMVITVALSSTAQDS